MKIASSPQDKMNFPVQRSSKHQMPGSEKSPFGKKLEEIGQKKNDGISGSYKSGVDALIRLGASSRAEGIDIKGEWRSVVYQLSDMNQDNIVTQAELQQSVVAGGGTEADANELYAFFGQFASPESNGGSLTVDDFKHGLATSTQIGGLKTVLDDFLDSNGDGEISADELEMLLDVLRGAGTILRTDLKEDLGLPKRS